MKKVLLSFAMAIGILSAAQAQSDYNSAIGLRIGGYYDVVSGSFKTHITEPGALEFNLGVRGYNGPVDWVTVAASATYQHHFPIKPVPGLRWYVGGGLTAYNSFSDNRYARGFGLGIYPTGGIDYKFESIPLNLSADVRPTFGIVDPYDTPGYKYRSFRGDNFGVSARYTF